MAHFAGKQLMASSACLRPVTSRKMPVVLWEVASPLLPWPRAEIQRTSDVLVRIRKSISKCPSTTRVATKAALRGRGRRGEPAQTGFQKSGRYPAKVPEFEASGIHEEFVVLDDPRPEATPAESMALLSAFTSQSACVGPLSVMQALPFNGAAHRSTIRGRPYRQKAANDQSVPSAIHFRRLAGMRWPEVADKNEERAKRAITGNFTYAVGFSIRDLATRSAKRKTHEKDDFRGGARVRLGSVCLCPDHNGSCDGW